MLLYNHHYLSINSERVLLPSLHLKAEPNRPLLAWIGIAKFASNRRPNPSILNGQSAQQIAVRKLLQQMLYLLQIDDTLQTDQFPYQLAQTGYYVCFSHSNHQVSCIVSRMPSAIDSELNPISDRIVERFYHPKERDWLATLPALSPLSTPFFCNTINVPLESQLTSVFPTTRQFTLKPYRNANFLSYRHTACAVLWMIKECFIKIGINNKMNLMRGLKQNYCQIAIDLLKSPLNTLSHNKQNNYSVIYLQSYSTVIVISL